MCCIITNQLHVEIFHIGNDLIVIYIDMHHDAYLYMIIIMSESDTVRGIAPRAVAMNHFNVQPHVESQTQQLATT